LELGEAFTSVGPLGTKTPVLTITTKPAEADSVANDLESRLANLRN
jgi:hypothetical protein